SPAFEIRLVPIGPACPDARAIENDLEPGPLLQPTLLPLQENSPLHHLEFGADTDILQLRNDALATRVVGWRGAESVNCEAVGIAGLLHELLGFWQVALELWPLDSILHVVVNPVAADFPHAASFGVVHGASVDGQAHGLPHALVVERVLGVLEAGEL